MTMTDPTTPTEPQTGRERNVIYIVIAVVVVALMVIGLFTYSSAKSTQQANDKADQLIAAIEDAGATAPSKDQIVRVLGDDGGATCADPNASLTRAILLSQLANGAAGPGARPVIADSRVVKGQLLIIEVYCPDELEDFKKFVDDFKTGNVAGD
jgi:Tfp pilus assembly protein FimT